MRMILAMTAALLLAGAGMQAGEKAAPADAAVTPAAAAPADEAELVLPEGAAGGKGLATDEKGAAQVNAQLLMDQGAYDIAEKAFERMLMEDPADLGAWQGLAQARHLQGKYAEAVDALRQAQKLKPEDENIRALLDSAQKTAETGGMFHASYPLAGVTLMGPAGINLAAGYYLKRVGFRVSGMSLGDSTGQVGGVQGNLVVKILETKKLLHAVSVLAGLTDQRSFSADAVSRLGEDLLDSMKFTYGGLAYEYHYTSFFLEAGVGVGPVDIDYHDPARADETGTKFQALFQVGWVWMGK